MTSLILKDAGRCLFSITAAALIMSCSTQDLDTPNAPDDSKMQLNAEIPSLASSTSISSTSISSVATKTIFDRTDISWDNEDLLSVMTRTGKKFSDNTMFVRDLQAGSSAFSGELSDKGSDRIYLYYPYQKSLKDRDGEKEFLCKIASGAQIGVNSQEHLKMPMWGFAATPSGVPEKIQMHHTSGLVQLVITNGLKQSISIQSVKLTSKNHPLSGAFNVLTTTNGFKVVPSESASKMAFLSVQDGVLNIGESGNFYLVVAPYQLAEGEIIEITVKTNQGEITRKSISSVKAGKLVKIDFSYSSDPDPDPTPNPNPNPDPDPNPDPNPEPGFDDTPITFNGKTYIPVFVDMDNDGKVDAGEVWLDRNIGSDSNDPGSAWGEEEVNWNAVGNFYYWGRPYSENSPCEHALGANPERNEAWELRDGKPGTGVHEENWDNICPKGYCIPTERQWRDMFNYIAGTGFDQSYQNAPKDRVLTFANNQTLSIMMTSVLKFPMTGIHDRNDKSPNLDITNNNVGTLACYWSRTFIEMGGKGKTYPVRVVMGKRGEVGLANIGPAKSAYTTASVRCVQQ